MKVDYFALPSVGELPPSLRDTLRQVLTHLSLDYFQGLAGPEKPEPCPDCVCRCPDLSCPEVQLPVLNISCPPLPDIQELCGSLLSLTSAGTIGCAALTGFCGGVVVCFIVGRLIGWGERELQFRVHHGGFQGRRGRG